MCWRWLRAGYLALLCASAHAAAPLVQKVSAPPPLSALAFFAPGRALTQVTSPDAFGASESITQWPGAYYRASFEGTTVFFRVGKSREILHVVVDGSPAAVLNTPDAGLYQVNGLEQGPHTITVYVATESQDAPNVFGGFALPAGEKAMTPAPQPRQIEFIGDSHTVGYGNLSDKRQCTEDEVWADTDDTQAFGALTASHYGADYQVNAISGRGVVRNYGGFKADTLPEAYPYVLLNKQQRYDDPAWKPQVLVIALGTNDFSTPLHAGERWATREELHADYEATYARFLTQLRAKNPNAMLIVWATDMAGGEIEAEAQKVVNGLKQKGDQHIRFVPVNGLSFGACNSHPSLEDEKVISQKLVDAIDADPEVWRRWLPPVSGLHRREITGGARLR